jgi:hypothetical protein
LQHNESQRQTKHPEQLEIDPGFSVVIVDDIQIDTAQRKEIERPHHVQSPPNDLGQRQCIAYHAFDKRALADHLAAKKCKTEQPVDDGRLPFYEQFILKQERRSAEDDNKHQCNPVHGFHLTVFDSGKADLGNRRDDSNGGRYEDSVGFVGNEEQQDREKIEEQLHK